MRRHCSQSMQKAVVHCQTMACVAAANKNCIECVVWPNGPCVSACRIRRSPILPLNAESGKMNLQCFGGGGGGDAKAKNMIRRTNENMRHYIQPAVQWKWRILLSGEQKAYRRLHTCQWFTPCALQHTSFGCTRRSGTVRMQNLLLCRFLLAQHYTVSAQGLSLSFDRCSYTHIYFYLARFLWFRPVCRAFPSAIYWFNLMLLHKCVRRRAKSKKSVGERWLMFQWVHVWTGIRFFAISGKIIMFHYTISTRTAWGSPRWRRDGLTRSVHILSYLVRIKCSAKITG